MVIKMAITFQSFRLVSQMEKEGFTCGAVFDTCLATEAIILAEICDILDETVIRISDDKMDLLASLLVYILMETNSRGITTLYQIEYFSPIDRVTCVKCIAVTMTSFKDVALKSKNPVVRYQSSSDDMWSV